jgi:hypothetical protein
MKTKRTPKIIAICVSLALTGPAFAQLIPLGPETRADLGPLAFPNCPQVVGKADRSFFVAWTEGDEVLGRRFNILGAPASGEISLDEGTAAGKTPFDLRLQQRPGFGEIAVWSTRDGSDPIRFDRWTPATGADLLGAPSYVDEAFPRRVGGYIGVWNGRRPNSLVATLLSESGTPSFPAFRRVEGAPSVFPFLDFAQAVDGSFTALWSDIGRDRFLLQRYGPTARPLGPPVVAIDDPSASAVYFASSQNGRTAVAWVDYDLSGGGVAGDLFIRFFGPNGQPTSAPQLVASVTNPGLSFNPEAIALDRQGRALLVWSQLDNDPPIEAYQVQLWAPTGAESPVLDLGAGTIRVGTPFCASATSAGRAWAVVWRAQAAEGEAIYVRRFFTGL